MEDDYGRPLTSLRISVTQDCNLDCFYCHKEGCELPEREMTPSEIEKLVEIGKEFGIEKVKITGGEPLVRDDIVEIIKAVSRPGIKDVSLTTNGVLLDGKVEELEEAGLDRVNISLDTLDHSTYEDITGKDVLDDVLAGIEASVESDLYPVKLNTIVLDGVNDGQNIERLIEYSVDTEAILQLIEFEEVLPENEQSYQEYHKDLDPIEERIRERAEDVDTRWMMQARSEERRVGKECRSRWSPYH